MTRTRCEEAGIDEICNFANQSNFTDLLLTTVNQWLHQTPRNSISLPAPLNGASLTNITPINGNINAINVNAINLGSGGSTNTLPPVPEEVENPDSPIKRSPRSLTKSGTGSGIVSPPSPPDPGKKILVVEDNSINQLLVSTILRKAGYPISSPHLLSFP